MNLLAIIVLWIGFLCLCSKEWMRQFHAQQPWGPLLIGLLVAGATLGLLAPALSKTEEERRK